jgi:hypothetical protein
MAGFRYRLYLANGEDIGDFTTATPVWKIGDEFYNRDHTLFRITDMLPEEMLPTADYSGVFVVTPVELAEPV